ncbi:16S rRNA (uracil(1498)-N(3))-methyltransferase [Aureitalea marina]|uniref:Ribosomal RNA small subunit methyltransferase E n=1 Tax=Aureitalea marina TaxID=930804 RepID=A0A2S7KNZ3_9FLAO|nr:16S rRNA (uracil(1498)-N(3))-methyltransferase [Aureitalea marina]PQB04349.1 16S rRNA (uracil(1498)-N(3))-methyltransferase [Aureitalea marina]
MQLFYQPDIDDSQSEVHFDKEESRHLIRVLRKKVGDSLSVTDGKGGLFTVEVTLADDKRSQGRIVRVSKQAKPDATLEIGIAPTKLNDRMEWFLEKSTEIGIHTISPIICDRSERRILKLARMERIIVSAAKQSLKHIFPKIQDQLSFEEYIKKDWPVNTQLFIAHCGESPRKLLNDQLQTGRPVVVLIGPEGDFTPKEVDLALKVGFEPVSLGKSRLRTETAGIVACHLFNLANP